MIHINSIDEFDNDDIFVLKKTGFKFLDELEKNLSKQYKNVPDLPERTDKYKGKHLTCMFCCITCEKDVETIFKIKKDIFTKHKERTFENIRNYFRDQFIPIKETEEFFEINKKYLDTRFPEEKSNLNNLILEFIGSEKIDRNKTPCFFDKAINQNELKKYTQIVFREIINLIKTNKNLLSLAKNFDSNNSNQILEFGKEFLNLYFKKYNIKVNFNFYPFQECNALGYATKENTISINSNHKFEFYKFLAVLVHESNHILDNNRLGFLNEEQIKISEITRADYTNLPEQYRLRLTEQVSFSLSKIFIERKKHIIKLQNKARC